MKTRVEVAAGSLGRREVAAGGNCRATRRDASRDAECASPRGAARHTLRCAALFHDVWCGVWETAPLGVMAARRRLAGMAGLGGGDAGDHIDGEGRRAQHCVGAGLPPGCYERVVNDSVAWQCSRRGFRRVEAA